MDEVIQEISFNEEYDTIDVSICFVVKSATLDPRYISIGMGVEPTHSWKRCDTYQGRFLNKSSNKFETINRLRDFGIWKIDTSHLVSSKRLEEHMNYIVNLLGPKKDFIKQLLGDPKLSVVIDIRKESSSATFGYDVNPLLLGRLLALCNLAIFRNQYTDQTNIQSS